MKKYIVQSDSGFAAVKNRICGDASHDPTDAALADKLTATRAVVDAVRVGGDDAVASFTERFDKVTLKPEQF